MSDQEGNLVGIFPPPSFISSPHLPPPHMPGLLHRLLSPGPTLSPFWVHRDQSLRRYCSVELKYALMPPYNSPFPNLTPPTHTHTEREREEKRERQKQRVPAPLTKFVSVKSFFSLWRTGRHFLLELCLYT